MYKSELLWAGFCTAATLSAPASAAVVGDPAGDFLSTYTGARTGDLDVVRAGVSYDGANFVFDSVQSARVGTTPTGFYVWGVDRGQGTARFGVISGSGTGSYDATRVLFDSVLAIRPGGTSSVTDLTTATPTVTNLAASSITVSGNELIAVVPAALFPSRGFSFEQYGFNLWPRDGAASAGNAQISDFAPDNGTFAASRVPEPASLGLLSLGVALLLGLGKKKHST